MKTRSGRIHGQGVVSGGHGGHKSGVDSSIPHASSNVAVPGEHISGQRTREKRKKIDAESHDMAKALTPFGKIYKAIEDPTVEIPAKMNHKIDEINILALERCEQIRIEAEKRIYKQYVEAEQRFHKQGVEDEERMAKRAEEWKLMMETLQRGDPM